MSTEEAIKRITEFGLYHAKRDLPNSYKTFNAFKMAIAALRQCEFEYGNWCACNEYKNAYCNICGWVTTEPWDFVIKYYDFCPKCGIKMFTNPGTNPIVEEV